MKGKTVKLPKRLPYEMMIIVGLLLGSCGDSATRRFTEGDYDRIDIADTNARNAIYRVNELEGRVEELERRLR
ncbi:MAG: hypothetical protein H2055_11275 [Sphingopyxis sp.]|nr:hypothetical protein [Sphingopyxis sp.]